jgi:hypothetical protein
MNDIGQLLLTTDKSQDRADLHIEPEVYWFGAGSATNPGSRMRIALPSRLR